MDLMHWYGRNFDPLLMARPLWFRMTLAYEALLFGPYYVAATVAFVQGKDWIRIPSLVWAASLATCATIAAAEEIAGPHASPRLFVVLALYTPWIVVPLLVLARMWRDEHPFTRVIVDPGP